MHHVLKTQELLDMILSSLPSSDLGNTICINKFFFQASQPFLWKTIRLNDALHMLGATRLDGPYRCHRILVPPTYETWKRFFEYAWNVKALIGFGSDASALQDAVRFLTNTYQALKINTPDCFFPRCRSFEWHGTNEPRTSNLDNLLISPTLEHFLVEGWDLADMKSEWFISLCDTLTTRLENLKIFHIDTVQYYELDEPFPNSHPYFNVLTTFAQSLTSVGLPGALATAESLGRLSQIKNLSRLQIQRENAFPFDETTNSRFISGNALEEFSSLNHIALDPLVPPMAAFDFFSRFSFSSLRVLRWNMPSELPDGIIPNLLATIANKCPELKFLTLVGEAPIDTVPVIPWSCFHPILGCLKLVYLKLRCCQVEMTFDNYTDLVRSRQGPTVWRVLQVFTSEPLHFPEVLGLFAKYSPGIQALSFNVYVDDDTGPFEFTQPFRMPINDLPLIPDPWFYLKTRFQFSGGIQQSETLLPYLTVVDFLNSRLMVPYAVQVAALFVALSKTPVYVTGSEIDFLNQIYAHTLDYHMNLEKRIKGFMSVEAEEYIDYCRVWFGRRDFALKESFLLFDSLENIMS